jgi:hypothetical protein
MKRPRRNNDLSISERELVAMTSDLEDAHADTLPRLRESLEGWRRSASEEATGFSRRSFLARAGLVTAGGVAFATVAGVGGAGAGTIPRLTRSAGATRSASAASLDVKVAALAASLENLAVATYSAGLKAATAGKLGSVPPAVAKFVTTAMGQHVDHAAAWNAIIVASGYQKISAPNATIQPSINATFAKVTDVAGLAKLALSLEEAAAATYLEAVGVVAQQNSIETAATIHPVEMQHVAILNFVLGSYPVPQPFATTTAAAPLSAVPALTK